MYSKSLKHLVILGGKYVLKKISWIMGAGTKRLGKKTGHHKHSQEHLQQLMESFHLSYFSNHDLIRDFTDRKQKTCILKIGNIKERIAFLSCSFHMDCFRQPNGTSSLFVTYGP